MRNELTRRVVAWPTTQWRRLCPMRNPRSRLAEFTTCALLSVRAGMFTAQSKPPLDWVGVQSCGQYASVGGRTGRSRATLGGILICDLGGDVAEDPRSSVYLGEGAQRRVWPCTSRLMSHFCLITNTMF